MSCTRPTYKSTREQHIEHLAATSYSNCYTPPHHPAHLTTMHSQYSPHCTCKPWPVLQAQRMQALAAVIPCKHPLNCRRKSLRQAAASGAMITSHMTSHQNQKVDQHDTTGTTCIGNTLPIFRCTNTAVMHNNTSNNTDQAGVITPAWETVEHIDTKVFSMIRRVAKLRRNRVIAASRSRKWTVESS